MATNSSGPVCCALAWATASSQVSIVLFLLRCFTSAFFLAAPFGSPVANDAGRFRLEPASVDRLVLVERLIVVDPFDDIAGQIVDSLGRHVLQGAHDGEW